ncbi:hypothetical protein L486_06370 [Kwoniella mangroviensis CBS 10435]|uniref:Uncharacterized protein n=1 Tax=Kwoniella mangroviensis CBS 10435 TaxID=1331196 RepID=A0A1B9ILC3_9TREE|nr:hypothetical protein L486_06370 [Kwoniella mangroviensis CBS 10435]
MSSALRAVWELPELRDHILWYLRNRNIAPLLTVNKQFFQYGVERIYRDLEYVDYKDLNRKFKNSPRTELYCDAVLTVDVTKEYNMPQPPNEWVYLFDIFPNASTIVCNTEILRRTAGSDCIEYSYSHLRMLQLVQPREGKAKLEWDTEDSKDRPKDTNMEKWRETTQVDLYLYGHFPPLPTIREREKIDLYKLIRSRMRKKRLELLVVHSVTLDYQ